jgi:hypothetical protein
MNSESVGPTAKAAAWGKPAKAAARHGMQTQTDSQGNSPRIVHFVEGPINNVQNVIRLYVQHIIIRIPRKKKRTKKHIRIVLL